MVLLTFVAFGGGNGGSSDSDGKVTRTTPTATEEETPAEDTATPGDETPSETPEATDTPERTRTPKSVTRTPRATLTPDTGETTYVVKAGDTLSSIAADFDITVDELKEANNLDSDLINVDQELIIP